MTPMKKISIFIKLSRGNWK